MEHYSVYAEPYAMSCGQAKYHRQIARLIGPDWTFRRFCEFLAAQKLLYIIRTRSGKHWLLSYDQWESLSDEQQLNLENLCDLLIDPYQEFYELKKQGKLISSRAKRRRL